MKEKDMRKIEEIEERNYVIQELIATLQDEYEDNRQILREKYNRRKKYNENKEYEKASAKARYWEKRALELRSKDNGIYR